MLRQAVGWSMAGIASLLMAEPVLAATLRVPSDYATINAAFDASAAGDTVLVAPGVYDQYETRLILGQFWFSSVGFLKGGVRVVSESGAGATTIRMDTTVGKAVAFLGVGSAGTTEVVGFTFSGTAAGISGMEYSLGGRLIVRECRFVDLGTGGSGEGALGSVQSDLEVYNCRFENVNGGGTLVQTSGSLLIEDSEFLNCRSGAISARYDASRPHATGLTMRRCRFVGNVKTNGGGGGVNVSYSSALIEESWFQDNYAVAGGGGVAMGGTSSSNCVLRSSVFVHNTAHGVAAAVWVSATSVVIEGNTFVDNETTLPQVFGGAVSIDGSGQRTVRRNVAVNSIGDPAFYIASTSGLTEGCNVFWNNGWGNAQGFTPSATDLEADPQFCDPAADDFHVGVGSPCIPGSGHPSCTELIGAWGEGCGTVAIPPATWGKVKSEFRTEVRP